MLQKLQHYYAIILYPLVKTDEVALEHKELMTLLDGERVLRVNTNKGKDDD